MQDQLRFTTQRRGDHVADVCTGWDRTGQAVDFELDTRTFLTNVERQAKWATRADAANAILQAYIRIGVSPDAAWELIEAALPAEMHIGTGWNGSEPVHQGVADRSQQPLERLDDLGGQAGDGHR